MKKLGASIVKEFLLLINDKVGLLLMYLMPVLLVFIITLVQDSTFKLVNENRLELLVINDDRGALGDTLIAQLKRSGTFGITTEKGMSGAQIQQRLLDGNELIAVHIPKDFSQALINKATNISVGMLQEFELADSTDLREEREVLPLTMYYDPVLQESFRFSILSTLHTYVGVLENRLMVEQLYSAMGFTEVPENMEAQFAANHLDIVEKSANKSSHQAIPNSAQHNVPAWSIFAMFFMVISLGGNIVKERLSGSFIRLQTIPASFSLVLISKMITYGCVALTQLTLIFALGKFVFPSLGLPALSLPSNLLGLFVVSLLSALSAISFAMLVGTYAKTQEQANGFGAISIIILAAIGGIWVPSFVMPSYLQTIGQLSPLHWCLEGYYTLFLKGGDWYLLSPSLLFLIIFILACQIGVYIKLKLQNYI
ncbi:MAG: ABC transporter [Bacteroidetes bacterium RIFCSPHIGHO2_02_FULL_44_7]|nr:MAG: ABC transporter [Bacteroidetes bacterium RIFCSPHIGHO2_02_FULL_44_7]